MKKIITLALLAFVFINCKDKDRGEETTPKADVTGNWKISHYIFKGKEYAVTGCDLEDRIVIGKDYQGSYKNSEYSTGINACDFLENLSGAWTFNQLDSNLVLKYVDGATVKTKTINLSEFSDINLKIESTTKNIDGQPGLDNAIEVWAKY